MDTLLEGIRTWVRSNAQLDSGRKLNINGLWRLRCMFQPTPRERKFNYRILVAQTIGQGACYYEGPELTDKMLLGRIGHEYDGQSTGNLFIDIALLDSVAMSFSFIPDSSFELSGSNSSKAVSRAELVVDEVVRLINRNHRGHKVRVCNVGAVSLLIRGLLDKGFDVTASDREKNVIGTTLFGKTRIMSASSTLDLVADSDIALVSGMTLSTRSLSDITNVAIKNRTKIVVFAETGAGFGPYYVNNGIDVVVSEPFPFYTFDCHTTINVFRGCE